MHDSPRPGRPLLPLLVLALFSAVLPIRFQGVSAGDPLADDQACWTLGARADDAPPAALVMLERCSSRHPDHAKLASDLGAAYERAGRPAEAERAYRRAIAADPDYADARLQLGRLLLRRGASAEAAFEAEVALHVQPNRRALVELLQQAQRERAGSGDVR